VQEHRGRCGIGRERLRLWAAMAPLEVVLPPRAGSVVGNANFSIPIGGSGRGVD